MAKITDEHKQEFSDNYFKVGVHKVTIQKVEFGKTQDDKEFAEFTVLGENGEEGTARIWFTTDAAIRYSFNTLRAIFVHNAPKNKKDEMRDRIDSLKDTKDLAVVATGLSGKECWYSVYENPERTYVGNDGKERHSFDRNVYGYEPKPRDDTPVQKSDNVEIEDLDAKDKPKGKDDVFGF